jgi:DNA-binding MarR family transcriptional regulator
MAVPSELTYIVLVHQYILSAMSDVAILLSALPRVHLACRGQSVGDPSTGAVVSVHQARILSHLDVEDPTMVTELAEFMGVTPSTMSLNLKRLREAGLVSSARDPDDRRVMNVRLTEEGARLRRGADELDRRRAETLLARLAPEERVQAVRALAVLAGAADRMMAEGVEPGSHGRGGAT